MSKSLPLTVHYLWIWESSVIFFPCGSLCLERGMFSLLAFLFTVKHNDHKQLWYEMDYFCLRIQISVHYLRKPRQEAIDKNWWRVPREVIIVALILIAFPVSFRIEPRATRPGVYCAQQTMPSHINNQSRKCTTVLSTCQIYEDVFQIPSFQVTLVDVQLMKKIT